MDSLRRLEEIFSHFPGIGPRQAKRFVHYIQGKSSTSVKELADLIQEVKKSTGECNQCHRFFTNGSKTCAICSDTNRDQATLMIVARDSDFETIEKSAVYKGLYFVLGGTVPVLDKEPDKKIRLKSLLERVNKDGESLKEIIISTNTTPDGDHTRDILKDAIKKIALPQTKISVLGRGLSTGAELEYADSETIRNALGNRK